MSQAVSCTVKLHHSLKSYDCISALFVSSGLSKLQRLNKLSLNGNQLSSLDYSVLDQLPELCFLSVENNCIASLHGIQRARSLHELYVCNNHISMSKDIYCLKVRKRCYTCSFVIFLQCPFWQELASLIILDLSGNPVEKAENYRIYVLFHLPALKALDGTAVVSTDTPNEPNMSLQSGCY